MMKNNLKKITAAVAISISALGLVGCQSTEYDQRKQEQNAEVKTESKPGDSLEQGNIRKKLAIEEKTDQIGYVYLFDRAGQAIGHYVVKGKVSSSGSQIAPEQEIICRYNSSDSCQAVDSAQDDGTYGSGDDGIFFFTTEGTFVHTSMDYLYTTQPMPVDAPELEK